jgi:alanine racemase
MSATAEPIATSDQVRWVLPAHADALLDAPDEIRAQRREASAWMEVDLDAITANFAALRRLAGAGTETIVAVKADAYGHGAVGVGRHLAELGADMLATGSLAEAVALREAGVTTPILLFAGHSPEAAPTVIEHGLTPTLTTLAAARSYSAAAGDTPHPVFVKVDAGLGRVGVPLDRALDFLTAVARLPGVRLAGVYTHVPFSDAEGAAWAQERAAAFEALLAELGEAGIDAGVSQVAASSGLSSGRSWPGSAVCPGHALYGIATIDDGSAAFAGWRPALHGLRARIIQLERHDREREAGMNGSARIPAGAVHAIVPAGMGDGYLPARTGAAVALCRGRRAPVVGVSLEHTQVDVTGIDGAAEGDIVTLIGTDDAGHRVTLEEVAAWQGVSPLQCAVGLGGKVPCFYLESPNPTGAS